MSDYNVSGSQVTPYRHAICYYDKWGRVTYEAEIDTSNDFDELTSIQIAVGNKTMQYLSNDGSVIAGEEIGSECGTTYLYNKDIQNSTKSLLDTNGDGVTAYDYSDFGETTITGNQDVGNEIAYTGGIYDKSTGLYYLNARYYDPENGRFLTEDTYRGEADDPDTWHLYAYCNNDLVNYVDPSGHDAIVLKSNFCGKNIGHMAVLIQDGKKWRYFSWAKKGYKTKYMNNIAEKGVKDKKVYHELNKYFKRTGRYSKYVKYLYIKGNFKNSLSYIKKVKAGKSYRKYSLTKINCAWMVIQVLRQSYGKTSSIYKALYNLQYQYVRYNKQTYVKTIIPKKGMSVLEDVYKQHAKNVIGV